MINPLFPKSKMIESVNENGGEITGRTPIVEISFLNGAFVLETTNAKRNPTSVENVAVQQPSLRLPHNADM